MSFVMDRTYDGDKTYEDGRQYVDDAKLLVRFETRAVKHEFKSNQEGRAIYYDADYISIIIPGSREINTFPMDEHYRARFKERYDKWKQSEGENQKVEGTLLAELPWMTKSQIAELHAFNIFTVEHLAEMSDANAQRFMGNFKLRERAKNFLAAAAGEAPAMRLQQELEKRDNHIEVLERKIADLTALVEKVQAKK